MKRSFNAVFVLLTPRYFCTSFIVMFLICSACVRRSVSVRSRLRTTALNAILLLRKVPIIRHRIFAKMMMMKDFQTEFGTNSSTVPGTQLV